MSKEDLSGGDNNVLGSSNPYSAPVEHGAWQGTPVYPVGGGSFVRQVKPLSICMIIQGVLEIAVGLMYVSLGILLPAFVMSQQGGPNGGPPIPPGQQQNVQAILGLVYGGMGGFTMIAGGLRIAAGWRGLYFRSYGLAVASLFIGLLDVFGCYCLPTSLALCVWGCIVLFKPEVKQAYRLGSQGHSPTEIEANTWQNQRG